MTKNLKRNFLTFFSINSLFGMVGTLIFGGLVMRFGSKRVMMLLTVPVFLCWVNAHCSYEFIQIMIFINRVSFCMIHIFFKMCRFLCMCPTLCYTVPMCTTGINLFWRQLLLYFSFKSVHGTNCGRSSIDNHFIHFRNI